MLGCLYTVRALFSVLSRNWSKFVVNHYIYTMRLCAPVGRTRQIPLVILTARMQI